MLFDLEMIEEVFRRTETQIGFLTFKCSSLGLWEGAEAILDGPIRAQVLERAKSEQNTSSGFINRIINTVSGEVGRGIQNAHGHAHSQAYWRNVKALLAGSSYRRALADFSEQEMSVLKATCVHTLEQCKHLEDADAGEFIQFFTQLNAQMVWAGGKGQFLPHEEWTNWPHETRAVEEITPLVMRQFVHADAASYQQDIFEKLAQYVQITKMDVTGHQMQNSVGAIANVVNVGSSSWAGPDNIEAGETDLKSYELGNDLLLGKFELGEDIYPVGFDGNESLVCIAEPGAGKTQGLILPNLYGYRGSIVALDPKLELMELTAGYRQSKGHRVLILSLADDDVPTHRFNVLDFVDRRPEFLWGYVIEFAEFLIPKVKGDTSPIFQAKAAEIFAVCMGGVVLEAIEKGEEPTFTQAISRVFSSNESLKNFFFDTQDRAEDYGCRALMESASVLAAQLNKDETVEDFMRFHSNATARLTKYRGGVIDRVADGKGDWRPEELREEGTTLYIRIPYEEMHVYGGYIRLILYIIAKQLRKGGTEKGRLPVTLLLDELAQLGSMDEMANLIETGRGFGVRLVIVLQDYQQAKANCSKPNLILDTPKLRLFMNPSLETAKKISEQLGTVKDVLKGRDKPVAEPAQLMGPEFSDSIIVLSSGSKPVLLKKHFAYTEPSYEEMRQMPYKFTKGGYKN